MGFSPNEIWSRHGYIVQRTQEGSHNVLRTRRTILRPDGSFVVTHLELGHDDAEIRALESEGFGDEYHGQQAGGVAT